MKNPRIENSKFKKLKILLLQYVKKLKTSKKT